MVRPSLEYAGAVWNSCRKMDVLTLEKTQVKIARIVLHLEGQRARLSDSAVLEKLEWPTLAWRRRLASLCLFWQLKNGLGPPRLTGRLPAPASERGPHSLRKPANFAVPRCASQLHYKSFLPGSIVLWNSLPVSVQSSPSLILSSSCFSSLSVGSFCVWSVLATTC